MNWIKVVQHEGGSLAWWHNEFRRERVDMEPGYQRRGNLWNKWKKAHLIDSILNGFDIPKFYVADFTRTSKNALNDKRLPYAVIDGKQRFEAIFSFFQGEIKLNPSSRYFADPTIQIAGLTYQDLQNRHPKLARRIDEYVPVVMSVTSMSRGMIEQMFIRLNSGVTVNGAERRNAMPGPVPQIIRGITVHPFFTDSVRFSKDRMQEFNLAAKLLMFEFEGDLHDTKAKNLDDFVEGAFQKTKDLESALEEASDEDADRFAEELDAVRAPYERAEQQVMETLDRMFAVFKERDPLLSKQGAIPVYYWMFRKNKKLGPRFRLFLEEFDPTVLDTVRLAREDPEEADAELLAYYNAARTSNDRSSMRARHDILRRRYAEWRNG